MSPGKLSLQLHVAEGRINQLQAAIEQAQDRAARAEKWLARFTRRSRRNSSTRAIVPSALQNLRQIGTHQVTTIMKPGFGQSAERCFAVLP